MSGAVKVNPGGPVDVRQRYADPLETMQTTLDNRQAQIQTMMPGIIVAFDPVTLTAKVQPALQSLQRMPDGTTKYVDTAELHDVPVQFPGGGGALLTFPVKKGDDCTLIFASRSIDFWHQLGGVQKPLDRRLHDINDAICQVGVRSSPAVPEGISGDAVQLRTDDGNLTISLDHTTGQISMKANTKVVIEATNMQMKGDVEITGKLVVDGTTFSTHTHQDDGKGPPNKGSL